MGSSPSQLSLNQPRSPWTSGWTEPDQRDAGGEKGRGTGAGRDAQVGGAAAAQPDKQRDHEDKGRDGGVDGEPESADAKTGAAVHASRGKAGQ
jgi:hypothetical protein